MRAAETSEVKRSAPNRVPTGAIRTQLQDLQANFADSSTQGTSAYVNQITLDHPEVDPSTAAADAILAVGIFADSLLAV